MTQWNKYSSKVWQDIANGEDLDSLAVDVDPDDYYDYHAYNDGLSAYNLEAENTNEDFFNEELVED